MMLHWAKLFAVLGAASALLFVVMTIRHAFQQADKLDAEVAKVGELTLALQRNAEQSARRDAASQGFQNEVQSLQAAIAALPVPVVRLCASPAHVPPAAPAPAAGPDPSPTAAGVVPVGTGSDLEAGPDIGPEIARLMDRADMLSAQTRAILALEGK